MCLRNPDWTSCHFGTREPGMRGCLHSINLYILRPRELNSAKPKLLWESKEEVPFIAWIAQGARAFGLRVWAGALLRGRRVLSWMRRKTRGRDSAMRSPAGGSFCHLLQENWRPPQKGILHYKGVDHFSTKGGKKTPLVTRLMKPLESLLFAPSRRISCCVDFALLQSCQPVVDFLDT